MKQSIRRLARAAPAALVLSFVAVSLVSPLASQDQETREEFRTSPFGLKGIGDLPHEDQDHLFFHLLSRNLLCMGQMVLLCVEN